VAHQAHPVEIIHAGAAEGAVADRKSGWFDQMGLDAETGAQTQNRAGILRDIGLEQRNANHRVFSTASVAAATTSNSVG
jgi:hypothetical protein